MAPFDRSHMTFYWSAVVNIALSGTVFQLFDVEWYHDLGIWVRGHSRSFKPVPFESLGSVSHLHACGSILHHFRDRPNYIAGRIGLLRVFDHQAPRLTQFAGVAYVRRVPLVACRYAWQTNTLAAPPRPGDHTQQDHSTHYTWQAVSYILET